MMNKKETAGSMEVLNYLQKHEIKNKKCDMDKPFVFISYAHDDNVDVIQRIFSELYDSGFNLWIDISNLPVDANTWEKAAKDAIKSPNCKVLVYFRSKYSLVKRTVKSEIKDFTDHWDRTGSDIITVDLSKADEPHTTEFMESLKETDSYKYDICKEICSVVSSHCNALRFFQDFKNDFNDFLGTLIDELCAHNIRQDFSIQEKVEYILEGTFHVDLNTEQKRVMKRYHFLLEECLNNPDIQRSLLIIGKPGVGKTVLGMLMLNDYIRLKREEKGGTICEDDLRVNFISKNSAPRETYKGVLRSRKDAAKGNKDEVNRYRNLLKISENVFRSAQGLEDRYQKAGLMDLIIVDEAHRLEDYAQYEKERQNKRKQPEAAAKVARLSVFFCDPEQMVSFNDYGTLDNLKLACAHDHNPNARYYIERMGTQMRCGGADSYMEWVDCLLQMDGHDEPQTIGQAVKYDLKVFDDPSEMFNAIKEMNRKDGPARVLAGMCWPWPKESRENKDVYDVVMPEYHFKKSWNLDYSKKKNLNYVSDKDSIEQIGCIHTVQGLEFTYAGVIIGNDMGFENGRIVIREKAEDFAYRINGEMTGKKDDYSNSDLLTGSGELEKKYKNLEKLAAKTEDKKEYFRLMSEAAKIKEEYQKKCHNVLRNVYRVLLTRGTKGCYIFCCDPELQKYMKEQVRLFNESFIN